MPYQIELKPKALKFLKTLPKLDNERVLERIRDLSINPRNEHVIKMSGFKQETYRARQGDYRIFFTIHDNKLVVEIIDIKNRQDAYNKK